MVKNYMDIKQLRVFIALAGDLHFARAGERLGISQSAISQQIKALEQRVGVRLLNRTTRLVKLTPAGEAFLAEIQQALEKLEAAPRIAAMTARGEAGELRIGYIIPAIVGIVPDAIQIFRSRYPNVNLQLRRLSSREQIEELMAERIDIGFIRSPIHESSLYSQVVAREGFVAVIPSDHRLAKKPDFELSDLAGEPLVQYNFYPESPYQARVMERCQEIGFRPQIVQQTTDTTAIVGLVASGIGLSILPVSVANIARHPKVTFRPLRELPRWAELSAVCRQDDTSARVKNFLRMLEEFPVPATD